MSRKITEQLSLTLTPPREAKTAPSAWTRKCNTPLDGLTSSPRFLRLPDVLAMTGLKRSSLYALIDSGDFPKPAPLTTRTVGFLSSEVVAWMTDRMKARDATKPR
jgi:prophage regulatory protein